MRATKKKAEILYKVLVKHFGICQFCVQYEYYDNKMYLQAGPRTLLPDYIFVNDKRLEFKWATAYIKHCCIGVPVQQHIMPLAFFSSWLAENSYEFKHNAKTIVDIKHEIVKCVFHALKRCNRIRVGNMIAMRDIHPIENIEELFIEEELNYNYEN